jgi:hypothetical protein
MLRLVAAMIPSTVELVQLFPRTREVEIDVIVGLELRTGSPAGTLMWDSVGLAPPKPPPRVERNVTLGGREADIVAATDDGHKLLVENKARHGHFQPGQPEWYKEQVDADASGRTMSCLVAPSEFIVANPKASLFHGRVSLEELGKALERAAGALGEGDSELALGYRYRAWRLDVCANDPLDDRVGEDVVAFGNAYRSLAYQMTAGAVLPGTFKGRSNRILAFERWLGAVRPTHKMEKGLLDCEVLARGWTEASLSAWLLVAPGNRCPPGWRVARAEKALVLRHDVSKLSSLSSFQEAEAIVTEAVRLLHELRRWAEGEGSELLSGPPPALLDQVMAAAARLAAESGRPDLQAGGH